MAEIQTWDEIFLESNGGQRLEGDLGQSLGLSQSLNLESQEIDVNATQPIKPAKFGENMQKVWRAIQKWRVKYRGDDSVEEVEISTQGARNREAKDEESKEDVDEGDGGDNKDEDDNSDRNQEKETVDENIEKNKKGKKKHERMTMGGKKRQEDSKEQKEGRAQFMKILKGILYGFFFFCVALSDLLFRTFMGPRGKQDRLREIFCANNWEHLSNTMNPDIRKHIKTALVAPPFDQFLEGGF